MYKRLRNKNSPHIGAGLCPVPSGTGFSLSRKTPGLGPVVPCHPAATRDEPCSFGRDTPGLGPGSVISELPLPGNDRFLRHEL